MTDRIERLEKDLSRIIGFTNSCDSKSSIIMSGVLAITALIIGLNGSSYVDYFKNKLESAAGILLMLLFIVSIGLAIAGISFIISSLYARVKLDHSVYHRSSIFYKSIASMEYGDYKESILSMTEEEYIEDLASQIHNNSVICNKKYELYNKGLVLSVAGLILLLVCSLFVLFLQ